MITVPFEQVDAFTTKPFAGNPAAVMRMPATGFLGDELLTKIAAENNLSEVSHVPTGQCGQPPHARPGPLTTRADMPTTHDLLHL